jgi:hypothetical protein
VCLARCPVEVETLLADRERAPQVVGDLTGELFEPFLAPIALCDIPNDASVAVV